jgi:hypothetical protein
MTFTTAADRLASLRHERDNHRRLCPLPAEHCLACQSHRLRILAAKRNLASVSA